MLIDAIESYLIVGALGFIGGIVISRIYFKSKYETKALGQLIDYSMIDNKINELHSMTTILNRLVFDIKENSEDITEKIELIKDIEENN